ncbi:protein Wiz isoform X3 [Silurus meridionalis]|uniref:C2H2-type domain-containing protein n=1 Tax=Silurus meridionalis TaxID=175797 RepID=A0A8T0B2E1_SILME|nr:protein Wiz isoform X3 [Silurus meridionalis]KAF7698141.1 hypothetical protein HF521_004651 [Silurus meridionalis]
MEPDVGPLSSMDPHDPTSIRELSGSPPLLSNSSMAGLSQGGDLERDDEDVNLLHKTAFYGNSERKQRSSAFASSLTFDSDSEKETFDEEELQQFSNPHGLAAHSPGSPTCEQEQDKLDCGVYRTAEKPKKIVLNKNPSSSLDTQGQDSDACRDPGMIQFSTQQDDQVGPLFSDIKPKEGYQKEKDDKAGIDQKRKDIKRAPERDVYTFPGDSDPESPPPGPWAHCTFIQRRRKKRALLRPFSGLNPWQCTPGTGRKTRVNASRAKDCSKFVNDKESVFEFKEEEEERIRGKKQSEEVSEELCQEIFTCVECSIYFKTAAHLREHMQEHCQDSGTKEQCGEDNSRRRRAKKGGFECMECGQNFTESLLLLDHHRRHQEARQKILEEMGKLKEGGRRARRKNSRKPNESMAICGQFVCLKCNFSSDLPQELADHAKTHTARTRAGGSRVSPRFQHKSYRKGLTRYCGNVASTTVVNDRYPTRASVQMGACKHEVDHLQATDCDPQSENKTDQFSEPSQNHTVSANPAEPPDKPELESAQTEAAPIANPSLQEESGSAEDGLGEENVSKLQSPESLVTNTKAKTKQKYVVFKGTGNRRSRRAVRRVVGRRRASSRLDPPSTDTSDTKIHMQNTEETTELSQRVSEVPHPEGDLMLTNQTTGVETSALALDLDTSTPPKAPEDSKEENEENTPDSEKDECSKSTTNEKNNDNNDVDEDENDGEKDHVDEDDGDVDDDGDNNVSDQEADEDVVNHLLEVLTEEEDEEDEEGMLLKTVEKKCPYCQDCFDNGIGLANHIRGHLNRVGVSYKVRHFISPEEVNAIEKKFSYQKKKKKVANFDPATFSVMRCEFCSAGFDTRAGLSSHARAHLRDFGITNWEVTASPINVLRELFSKRPELALSITPASNSETPNKKQCKEEEEESLLINDEENGTSELGLQMPASPTQPWRESQNEGEADGGNNKGVGDERMPLRDDFSSSPESNSSAAAEDTNPKGSSLLKCEVCCALFETRRGLSSHARSHLRQLGVGVSESSGAPIDLLYQITKERSTDSHLPASPRLHSPTPSPKNDFCIPMPSPSRSTEFEDEPEDIKPFSLLHSVAKSPPSPSSPSPSGFQTSSPFGRSPSPSHSLSASPSPVLRKAPISSLLPVSSPLRSHEHRTMSRAHNSALSTAASRPLWAPQETEAPLNLTMDMDSNTDIICKLCGAWFETRKGLSSHARAHLRHFGVEYSESKGSPIDLLNTLILTDDFKRRATSFRSDSPEDLRVHGHSMASLSPSTSTATATSKRPFPSNSFLLKKSSFKSGVGSKATSSSSSSSTHTMLSPPTKKLKTSQQVFRLSGREMMSIPLAEPMKDVCCEFCGELFENRKGLSSHARSHLRQLGITEWSVNGSPIDTLRDLITRRGLPCVMPLKTLKSSSSSSSPGPPRTLHQYSSPPGGVLGRQTFSLNQHQSAKMAVSAPVTSTSLAVQMVKPKPEPEQVEIMVTGGERDAYSSESLHPSWMRSDNTHSINQLMTQEREPSRDIRCEFCGEFFENRKGLSSHARSHLRHMGITEWSVNGSPIDTLWEIMRNQGNTSASVVLGVKEEPGQERTSPWDSQGYHSSRFSPKASVNLLHSSPRHHKHGFRLTGLSNTPPAGKFLGMKPTGKRLLGNEGHLSQRSTTTQSKTFSPPPQDFSFKGRMSTEKYGVGRMDASCELCGFAFENRKALASHARAHLRQFGVTEWSVNGSPIETLSAWMRSRPQTVAELHRSYLLDGHIVQKKKQSAAGQWASLTLSHGRTVERQIMSSSWSSLSRTEEVKNRNGTSFHSGISTQERGHHSSNAIPHAQVARSELNVRVTRGIERRPLKHPSHADGGERESCPPKPPRTSTVPALVPKPPSTPLVKLVGKIYSLKCRFCDVEFHGPLSVQEDWIRHLQQHILKLDYHKPAPSATNTPAKSDMAVPEIHASATTSTSTTATTAPTPTSATSLNPKSVSTPCPPVSLGTPTSTPTLTAPTLAIPEIPTKAEQEVDTPAT